MLNKFKRKDWGEEKNLRGGDGGGEVILLNSFNMAPEIEFASLNFPPSHKTSSYTGYSKPDMLLADLDSVSLLILKIYCSSISSKKRSEKF